MNSTVRIKVERVDFYYGRQQALKKVDMDVFTNKVTAIIGPSGCGKSTLIRLFNRMNDVVKTLTLITTLFMPVSFLAGFFGMNFFQATIPFEVWTGRAAFGLVLSAMILLPLGMYLWMRRRARM